MQIFLCDLHLGLHISTIIPGRTNTTSDLSNFTTDKQVTGYFIKTAHLDDLEQNRYNAYLCELCNAM